jgi:hypothetical protein
MYVFAAAVSLVLVVSLSGVAIATDCTWEGKQYGPGSTVKQGDGASSTVAKLTAAGLPYLTFC